MNLFFDKVICLCETVLCVSIKQRIEMDLEGKSTCRLHIKSPKECIISLVLDSRGHRLFWLLLGPSLEPVFVILYKDDILSFFPGFINTQCVKLNLDEYAHT